MREDQRDGAIIGGSHFGADRLAGALCPAAPSRLSGGAGGRRPAASARLANVRASCANANGSLQTEIDERRRTEARLRTTQNELVQAGKLAALGQMSAAIAHEINQPLAAIRTFMASTKIFAQRGDLGQVTGNLDLINDLPNAWRASRLI